MSVEGLSVEALLAALSDRTGADLRAKREIAHEKVVIFGPERPLHELLEDLATLLGGRWEQRRTLGRTGYVLHLEDRVRRLASELAAADTRQWRAQAKVQVRAPGAIVPRIE